MGLFSSIFNKKEVRELQKLKEKSIEKTEGVQFTHEITAVGASFLAPMDDEETVAAIMATVTSMLLINNFVVKNIKRSPEFDSIWAHAGRMKLMR